MKRNFEKWKDNFQQQNLNRGLHKNHGLDYRLTKKVPWTTAGVSDLIKSIYNGKIHSMDNMCFALQRLFQNKIHFVLSRIAIQGKACL